MGRSPGDEDQQRVGEDLQQRPQDGIEVHALDAEVAEVDGLVLELAVGEFHAAERADHADAVQGFFGEARDVTRRVLHLPGQFGGAGDEDPRRDDDGHDQGQDDEPELPVHDEHHREDDDDLDRVHDEHEKAEGREPSEEAEIAHDAAQQLPGFPLLVERHGQLLELVEQVEANVRLDLRGGLAHDPAPQEVHPGVDGAGQQDERRREDETGEVTVGDGAVDHAAQQHRDRNRHEDADGRQHEDERKTSGVGPDVFQQPEECRAGSNGRHVR